MTCAAVAAVVAEPARPNRRPPPRRSALFRTVSALAALALAACSVAKSGDEPGALADQQPGATPSEATTEGGLWMVMDKAEEEVKTSGRVIRDPALQSYVEGIICRLSPEYCNDIRVYIVEQPYFNASMAPNGMMQVWTGLLLRTRDEAELAYVLGHEVGHYQRRHTLQRFENLQDTATGLNVLGLVTLGLASIPAALVGAGSVSAFSRDQEREADDLGFDLLSRAGYDPGAAADTWDVIVAEREAEDDDQPFFFFASHPATDERIETLRELRDRTDRTGRRFKDRFRDATRSWRPIWMEQELRKRRLKAAQVVLDHVYENEKSGGEALFFQGEIYRLRGEDGDDRKAAETYEQAVAQPDVPPEAWRALGDVRRRLDDGAGAADAYRAYLRAAPNADDRAFIESFLQD